MGKKVKCAYIYLSQTVESEGSFNGSGGLVGLSTGGLGVGVGGMSGSTTQTNQSKLAELFRPVKNEVISSDISNLIPNLALCAVFLFIGTNPNFLGVGEGKAFVPEMVKLTGLFGALVSLFSVFKTMTNPKTVYKYDTEEFKKIQEQYNEIEYDLDEHIILFKGTELPASRENFIKLCKQA